jgi:hypothetical protein
MEKCKFKSFFLSRGKWDPDVGKFLPFSYYELRIHCFECSCLVMGHKDSIEWESAGDRMYSATSHSAISWQ